MKRTFRMSIGAALVSSLAVGTAWAQAINTEPKVVDMGKSVVSASALKEGLFPEESCEELKAAGLVCMGIAPAVRYSLPVNAFKLGSAEIPGTLKKQLDVFAEVLKSKRGSGKVLRVEGHADASGAAALNQSLSQRRAEAVKGYLVDLGADAGMLEAVGMGASIPKVKTNPFSAENRRVEIGRATPPS